MQLGDARKLDQQAQEALRHRAVLLVEKGATHLAAALAVGVHRGTLSRWCGTYRRDGASGLEKRKRGRRAGGRLMLTAAEARRAQRFIRDKMPDQMQLPFALWTAHAVRELIRKKFGKTLGLSTMPLYLKRWGLTAQRPLTRATPRDPQRIAAWLRSDYPSIAARAKREKAAIHWSGETGVRDQEQIGRFGKSSGSYAPEGQTPVLTRTRQKLSIIAAVSNRGLMRFKFHEGALNGAIFIDFMTRLVRDAKQKVFLIVGDPRVHHACFDKSSGAIQEWLARHKDEIEIFTLPADSLEHTADELNRAGRIQSARQVLF
jgi:transposase